jgi:hypothetical protein
MKIIEMIGWIILLCRVWTWNRFAVLELVPPVFLMIQFNPVSHYQNRFAFEINKKFYEFNNRLFFKVLTIFTSFYNINLIKIYKKNISY